MTSSYSDRRFQFIGNKEGFRSTVYPDPLGIPTVAYGFNLAAPENRPLFESVLGRKDYEDVLHGKASVSPEEGRLLFDAAADRAEGIVRSRLPGIELNDNQRLALTSMAYNSPNLIGPRLVAAIQAGDWGAATDEITKHSNKYNLPGITTRRQEEADLLNLPINAQASAGQTQPPDGSQKKSSLWDNILGALKDSNMRQAGDPAAVARGPNWVDALLALSAGAGSTLTPGAGFGKTSEILLNQRAQARQAQADQSQADVLNRYRMMSLASAETNRQADNERSDAQFAANEEYRKKSLDLEEERNRIANDRLNAGSGGKALRSTDVKDLEKMASQSQNIDHAISTFKPEYSTPGITKVENFLGKYGIGGEGLKDQADWWKQNAWLMLDARHQAFGSALTANEQQAWDEATIQPGMDPDLIIRNMKIRKTLSDIALNQRSTGLAADGFSEDSIKAHGALDELMSPEELKAFVDNFRNGNSNKEATAEPPRVATDEDYNKLPSGTQFIGPDGKVRRKP